MAFPRHRMQEVPTSSSGEYWDMEVVVLEGSEDLVSAGGVDGRAVAPG